MAATKAAQNRKTEFKWYVYALFDPDTRKPFYIGKGSGNRSTQHERDVRGGREINAAKEQKIKFIINQGKNILVQHLAYFNCENTAYNFETRSIKATNGLTNIARNKHKPITKSLMGTISKAIDGTGSPKKDLEDLIMFKKIAILEDHHKLIDCFIKVLKNQTYVNRVYA